MVHLYLASLAASVIVNSRYCLNSWSLLDLKKIRAIKRQVGAGLHDWLALPPYRNFIPFRIELWMLSDLHTYEATELLKIAS